MILSLCLLLAISLTTNVGLLLWSSRLERERGFATADARASLERLTQARKDGFEVPELPALTVVEPPTESLLTPELQSLVDEWESAAGKSAQLSVIRRTLATGKSQRDAYRSLVESGPEVAADV